MVHLYETLQASSSLVSGQFCLFPRMQNSLEHMGQGGEPCGCACMAQDNVVMMWDGGCEYLNWFFNGGLEKGGKSNSVFWYAEWIFVPCLKFREETQLGKEWALAWSMQGVAEFPALSDFWGGQCHRTQSGERFWWWHYQHFPKEIIPSQNFQWDSITCWYWNASTDKLHFSYFILSMPLNSPFTFGISSSCPELSCDSHYTTLQCSFALLKAFSKW